MNGPTRSSSFDRRAPLGGGRTRGPSPEVFDELDQFVDSEPVAWPGAQRVPADPGREAARGRAGRTTARGGEGEAEAAFSRKPAPSRRDAFAMKLDEELSKPPEKRAEKPPAQERPPQPERPSHPERAARPERSTPSERPDHSARPAEPERGGGAERPPAAGRRPVPESPAAAEDVRRRSGREAFARSAAEAVAPLRSAERAQQRAASPVEGVRGDPDPPANGRAGDIVAGGSPSQTAAEPARDEPADALEWELDNAIGAIVSSSNRAREAVGERQGLPPLPGPSREPPTIPPGGEDAAAAARAAASAVRHHPSAEEVRARRTASARGNGGRTAASGDRTAASGDRAAAEGDQAAHGDQAAPARPAAPVAPLGTRRATPIQTFRYERQDDPHEGIPPAPPDVDDPLQSMFFPEARDAFDEVHGGARGVVDPYLSELDQDDEEFDPDADWVRTRRADEELPPSLSRAARKPRQRPRLRTAGIAAVVGGIAVLGVVAVVAVNLLGGGGSGAPSGEPPIIRADARDVKERAEDDGAPVGEPDVIEQTELTGTGELVVPDQVRIGDTRSTAGSEAGAEADDPFPSRPVRTLVVRPDGTILPATPDEEAGERTPARQNVADGDAARERRARTFDSPLRAGRRRSPSLRHSTRIFSARERGIAHGRRRRPARRRGGRRGRCSTTGAAEEADGTAEHARAPRTRLCRGPAGPRAEPVHVACRVRAPAGSRCGSDPSVRWRPPRQRPPTQRRRARGEAMRRGASSSPSRRKAAIRAEAILTARVPRGSIRHPRGLEPMIGARAGGRRAAEPSYCGGGMRRRRSGGEGARSGRAMTGLLGRLLHRAQTLRGGTDAGAARRRPPPARPLRR